MTSSNSVFGVRNLIVSAALFISAFAVLALFVPGFAHALVAPTYYVDASAAPGGNGTQALPFKSIQAAIDAAPASPSNTTVLVRPGTYNETATSRTVTESGGTYQFGLFVGNDRAGIKIEGTDDSWNPVTDWHNVAAHVTTNATNDFGPSGIFVEGDNVTIQGLDIGANTGSMNKSVEVIGNNFTFNAGVLSDPDGGDIYISDFTGEGTKVQSYHVTNSHFTAGASLDIASGAGADGSSASTRTITGNTFDGAGATWALISFNGIGGRPWYVYKVGAATITGNTFAGGTEYIRSRGTTSDDSAFDWHSYFTNNTFDASVIDYSDISTFAVRPYSYTTDTTFTNVRGISTAIQPVLDRAASGDSVVIGAGTYSGPLTFTKNNIALLGTSGATVNETSTDSFGYGVTVDNATGVVIKRIAFNAAALPSGYAFHAYHADGLGLTNVSFTGPGKTSTHIGGIDINTSSNVGLLNVSSTGFYKNGIAVSSKYASGDPAAHDISFTNVSSTNNGWSGISFYTVGNDHSPASIGGSGSITNVSFSGANTISGNTQVGLHIEGDSDANEGAAATPANTVTTDGTTLNLNAIAFSGNSGYDVVNYQTAPVNALTATFGGLTGNAMNATQRSAEDSKIVDKLDHAAYGLVTYYAASTVTVTIDAYVNGVQAATANTANSAFPMHAIFPGGEGDYTLSPTGYNNPEAYKATTSDMPSGSNYSTYQTDAAAAQKCTAAYPFRLIGYGTGDTLADAAAQASTPSQTVPSFTNLTTNKFVVAFFKTCPPAPTPVTPSMSGTTVTNAELPKIDWSDVSDSLGPVSSYNYEVSTSADTNGLYGSFTNIIYSESPTNSEISNGGTPDGTYYWHEQAVDAAGHVGPWTAPMSITFHTVVAPPAAAVTTNDASGVSSNDATLNGMNGPTAADGHSFWASLNPITVGTDPGVFPANTYSTPDLGAIAPNTLFSALLSSITTNGVPSNMPAITPNTTYHFVAWSHVAGHWLRGEDKTVMTSEEATPADTTVAAPVLVSPADNSTFTTESLHKTDWSDVTDPSSPVTYIYESSHDGGIGGSGAFQNPAYVSGPLTQSEVAHGGTPEGVYYFHVQAIDGVGNHSAWSSVRKLTVNNSAASCGAGYTLANVDGQGQCVPTNPMTAPTCAVGVTQTEAGCVATVPANPPTEDGPATCSAGTLNEEGTCDLPPTPPSMCSGDAVLTDGQCVVPNETPTCSGDLVLSSDHMSCVAPVTPDNTAPVANDQSVTTAQDNPVGITLTATDADNNELAYSIVTGPANGTLSGTGADQIYTPNSGYSGTDSFTFMVNDGEADSNTAAISITVNAGGTVGVGGGGSGGGSSSRRNGSGGGRVSTGSTGSTDTGGQVLGATVFNFTRDLFLTLTGADVTELQTELITAGYLHITSATGYFGTLTRAAVAAWQSDNGIFPAAGYFGPISRAKYSADGGFHLMTIPVTTSATTTTSN